MVYLPRLIPSLNPCTQLHCYAATSDYTEAAFSPHASFAVRAHFSAELQCCDLDIDPPGPVPSGTLWQPKRNASVNVNVNVKRK